MPKPKRSAKRTRRPVARPVKRTKSAAVKKKPSAKTVDTYVSSLPSLMQQMVNKMRALVAAAAPEAIETLKWAQPVYEANGPFGYIKAHGKHVNLGFWRGAMLDAPAGILEGDGDKMRHIKFPALGAIDEELVKTLVRQAVLLNSRLGDPTKRS